MSDYFFPHEKLDCYRLARDVARWIAATDFPRGDGKLKDQARRAARSVMLKSLATNSCGACRSRHRRLLRRRSSTMPSASRRPASLHSPRLLRQVFSADTPSRGRSRPTEAMPMYRRGRTAKRSRRRAAETLA